jgi:hypothetical protein
MIVGQLPKPPSRQSLAYTMLAQWIMENTLTTYVEFADRHRAEDAVRALKSAGFEDIEIEDLSHGLQMATDVGESPAKPTRNYSLAGLGLGAILGCGWGILVFGIPAGLLDFPHAAIIATVGTLLCIGAGAVVGLEQAFVFVGRMAPDPTSALDGHPVGVRVKADRGARLIRAKEILTRFAETSPRQQRWWVQRRWSHQIGT